EIRRDEKKPLAAVQKATRKFGPTTATPRAGADSGQYSVGYVSANEFFPRTLQAKVNKPVTWHVSGLSHTVSFNVPAYFPVFTIGKNRDVRYDKRAQDAVRWTVPKLVQDNEGNSTPRAIDVGKWDGTGGFHSSGLLGEDDSFTLTFTKPGTYPY